MHHIQCMPARKILGQQKTNASLSTGQMILLSIQNNAYPLLMLLLLPVWEYTLLSMTTVCLCYFIWLRLHTPVELHNTITDRDHISEHRLEFDNSQFRCSVQIPCMPKLLYVTTARASRSTSTTILHFLRHWTKWNIAFIMKLEKLTQVLVK